MLEYADEELSILLDLEERALAIKRHNSNTFVIVPFAAMKPAESFDAEAVAPEPDK